MSRKTKPLAKPVEHSRPNSAIVLDHSPADRLEELHLAALAHRLFASGIAHLTLIGAGQSDPASWPAREPLGAWRGVRERAIGTGSITRHFEAAGAGMTLLPPQSGRSLILAAARLQYEAKGAEPVSVVDLDRVVVEIGGPAPDLIIVTGGTKNLSGGLTWPAAYAEFVFFEQPWARLTEQDLDRALGEFAGRSRRFGGTATAGAR